MRRKTIEEVKKEILNKVGSDYEVLSDNYENKRTKLKIKHKPCGNIIYMDADGLLNRGNRCKYCATNRSWAYTTEEFKKKMLELEDGEDYELLDKYKNVHTLLRFKHKKCGKIFKMRPNNFLDRNGKTGNRCPFCPSKNTGRFHGGESTGEQIIEKYLKEKLYSYEKQVPIKTLSSSTGRQRFDFKVNIKENDFILIEYDGRFHFEPKNVDKESKIYKKYLKQKESDTIKDNFCSSHNIKLFRISYKIGFKQIFSELDMMFNDYIENSKKEKI